MMNPKPGDVSAAIREVFSEEQLELSEAELAEHPNCWIEYGYEEGENWSTVAVDCYRTGLVRFTQYADQDDDEPMREEEFNVTDEAQVLDAMLSLSKGNIQRCARLLADAKPRP